MERVLEVIAAHPHLPKLSRHLPDTASLRSASVPSGLRLLSVRGLLASLGTWGVVGRLLRLASVAGREELSGGSSSSRVGDGRVKRSSRSVGVDVGSLSCSVLPSLGVVGGRLGRGGWLERVVLSREGREGPIGRLGRVLPLRLPLRTCETRQI